MQWLPPRTGYEPFTGRLLAFDIDGIDLPLGYPSPSLGLDKRLMADTWRATATIDGDGLTPRLGAWWEWCVVVVGIACGALFSHLLLATPACRLRP